MSADFLDSNVILYAFLPGDARKQDIAQTLLSEALAQANTSISFQVVQETLNVLVTKGSAPMPAHRAAEFMREKLLPLWDVMPTLRLYERGLELQQRYGYSFYDSLIVAAALEAGCSRLLTEDLQHGQRIESLVIEDPFRE